MLSQMGLCGDVQHVKHTETVEPDETFWMRVAKSMGFMRPTLPPSLDVGISAPSEAEDFPHLNQVVVPDSAMGQLLTQYAWSGTVDMEMQVYRRHLYHLLAAYRASLSQRVSYAMESGRSAPKVPYYNPSLFCAHDRVPGSHRENLGFMDLQSSRGLAIYCGNTTSIGALRCILRNL